MRAVAVLLVEVGYLDGEEVVLAVLVRVTIGACADGSKGLGNGIGNTTENLSG